MQTKVATQHFNGNVLVAKSGKVVYQKAFGYRNYTTKEPLNNNSVFELASISKQFTAMGILLLVEKSKLKLSDTLRKFFPELSYPNITIQHLLTHTSGLPDYMDMLKTWPTNQFASNQDVLAFLVKTKPTSFFKPGEKWKYSNTGFVLLASIIEKVSGQLFPEYMNKNIFKPLRLQHTSIYNSRHLSGTSMANYAYGYVYSESRNRYILPDSLLSYRFAIPMDGIQGDGNVNATTTDLLKWDRALKNNSLLSKTTQQQMLSAQVAVDPSSAMYLATKIKSYGYGIGVGTNKYGNYLWHGGNQPGYATNLIRYVEEDITIIVLSNNASNVLEITEGLAGLMIAK
ncbi:MAG: serine hydrolase domain-containing protein [Adhaeribacter sp.]